MNSAKISIVTPSFNQGAYIEDAIRSVLDQGYEHFEHIIMDNCSTDETLEIIARYPHIDLVSEPDKGQSDALNKGFLRATGDVIGWLNADDFYLPGTFHQVNSTFQRLPKVDAIYGNIRFINKYGEHVRNLRSHRPLKWLSLFYTYIQSTAFFFRREIVEANHLLDQDLHYKMDKDFFARLLYSGYKFKYVNAYFASFRWHDSNKSNRTGEADRKSTLEGFRIFIRYAHLSWKPNPWNLRLYRYMNLYVARPVRAFLKLLST